MNRKRCRTCLRYFDTRNELISLFDYDKTLQSNNFHTFADMLRKIGIYGEEISSVDSFPKRICILCCSAIRTSYYFQQEAKRSLEVLKSECLNIKQEKTQIAVISSARHLAEEQFNSDNSDNILDGYSCNINEFDQEIIDYEPLEVTNIDNGEEEEEIDNSQQNDSTPQTLTDKNTCNICNKTFSNSKALVSHIRFHQANNNCIHCDKKFLNSTQLKFHVRAKHPEHYEAFRLDYQEAIVCLDRLNSFHECSNCLQKFISLEALYIHHGSCDHKCIECGLVIPRTAQYFKHLETVHQIRVTGSSINTTPCITNIECPFCFLSFADRNNIQEHIQQCHPEENSTVNDSISEAGESTSNDGFVYQCQACPAKFSSIKGLNQHKTLKHSVSKSKAGDANENKSNNRNFLKYTRDEFLEKFMVKKSKDFHRCIPCKKEIGIRSIVLHMRSKHAATRSFRCELCPEAFFRADYRQRHFASSHPDSYKCFSCNIQFDRAHKIDSHNYNYHNIPIKNPKPDEGEDVYDLSPNAIKYIENIKNYDYADDFITTLTNSCSSAVAEKCPMTKDEFCEKYISFVSEKNVHCSECQQDIQKNSLISHLLWKHSVDKPLKCPFCNERVVKNNARLLHMAKCHPNSYKCGECNIQFVKYQNLVDHYAEVHRKKCTDTKSSGEMEDLQLNEMRFLPNRNEDDGMEDLIMNETEILNFDTMNNIERKFNCTECNKSFTTSKNLLIHKSHKHKLVEEAVHDSVDQQIALNDEMSYEEFRCNWTEDVDEFGVKCLVCEQILRKKNLINHLKARHSTTGAYLCEICNESFFKPEDRLQHFSTQHNGIFYCQICNIQHVCNYRYAKHMKEVHLIDMDYNDRVEVDLNVNSLRFVASIRKVNADRSLASNNEEFDAGIQEEEDPMEEMMQQMSNTEEMSRSEFMMTYFKNINRETKHCTACNKNFQTSSLYHHLVHFHATVFPFKCSFCDLRLERSWNRARHMQIFHPNEYKCNMCGIQFQKHAKYADHMNIEHGQTIVADKSPLEEEDIPSANLRYVPHRAGGDNSIWTEDDINPITSSTMVSYYYQDFDNSKSETSVLASVKDEEDKTQPLLEEIVMQNFEDQSECGDTYSYQDFKDKFLKNIDGLTFECVPCKRVIIKTSVCAHLRLWHASKMMFNCELCPIGFRRQDYRQRHMASTHPNDYLCSTCNQQFYRSTIYVEHMKNSHNMSISIPELKSKDEIDVPLENLTFMPSVPESSRIHPEESIRTKRRLSIVCDDTPINPKAGGLTYNEFCTEYIREEGEFMRCLLCKEKFSKLSIKKHLKKLHATSRPYKCELCEESFFRMDERMTHMKLKHRNSLKCSICDTQFYMSKVYVEHMRSQHSQNVKALTNKGKFDVDVPIERLRFVVGNGNPKISTIAPKKKIIENFDHIPDDAEMTREQFSKKFMRAVKPKTGEAQSRCLGCQKVFSSKNRYFHILHNHVVKRPLGCEFCPMRFFTSFKRIKHMSFKHPQSLSCIECNIQFERTLPYALHLKEHHQIITDTSNYDEFLDVPNDQLRFTKKSTSVRELSKEQQKESSFDGGFIDFPSSFSAVQELKCFECNLEFDSSRSYRSHMRDHGSGTTDVLIKKEDTPLVKVKVEEKPKEYTFECDQCDKKFSTKFAINAHKKFKHLVNIKRKLEKQIKFEVECEICNFTSFRRDYVEHHVKATHKGELYCSLCKRQLSNYNYFLQHMSLHSFESKEDEISQKSLNFKCAHCPKYFKFEQSKLDHENFKHTLKQKREFFCNHCNVNYHTSESYDVHLEGYKHKHLVSFLENLEEEPLVKVKEEEMSSGDDGPSAAKRLRLHSTTEQLNSSEDKLDYLKYIEEHPNGNFKCGICGKTKLSRKFLLHHLKQHEEVPTFNCDKCPERFVFKKKYEKHMKMHENVENNEMELIVNEHPKFQENIKTNEIRCEVCKINFKLTIMFNKHNTTWHSEGNPNRSLSMQDQKQKGKESGTIKLYRCSNCAETYYKHEKLLEHIEMAHGNKYKCDKCNLTFVEEQFLLNHQKLFCIHRSNSSNTSSKDPAKFVNEQ